MSTNSGTKINQLLQQHPQGTVLLSSWLVSHGYSHDLQHRYLKSGWLTSLSYGAMKRTGETINLNGALYSLQSHAKKIFILEGALLWVCKVCHIIWSYIKKKHCFLHHVALTYLFGLKNSTGKQNQY